MKKSMKDRNHTIHQHDSIYQGRINHSYQKDGFGILQTFQFETYIGYWKSNKAEGLGLIIYPSGSTIYCNFSKDEIEGVGICDNKKILRCGVFRNNEIVGIGYEYEYTTKNWKMVKYHKGVPIEVIKEETCDIETSLPKIVHVEQALFFHLHKYVEKNYFENLQDQFILDVGKEPLEYGHHIANKLHGPGVIISNRSVIQCGFFDNGRLEGWGFRSNSQQKTYQFGCYHKGKKNGSFYEKKQHKQSYNQYKKDQIVKNLSIDSNYLLKKQKQYNFNSKDFFSSHNTIPFATFQELLSPLEVRAYEKKKYQKVDSAFHSSFSKRSLSKKDVERSPSKKRQEYLNKYTKKQKPEIKSSVQIMREKISNYQNFVNRGQEIKFPSKGIHSDDELEIADEQNPFSE